MKKNRDSFWHYFIVAVSIILLFLQPLALLIVSENSSSFYKQPELINQTMDFSNYDYNSSAITPFGEYRLYYNRWVVSEKDTSTEDGLVHLPSTFEGTRLYDGTRLDKDGYGSYQIDLINLKAGSSLAIQNMDYGNSIRVYFNDQLSFQRGYMVKDPKEMTTNAASSSESYTVPEDGKVTMTIEFSNNGCGGLTSIVHIEAEGFLMRTVWMKEAYVFFTFGFMIVILLAGFIFVFSGKEKLLNLFMFVLSACLFLYTLFSTDGIIVFDRFNIFRQSPIHLYLNMLFLFLFESLFCLMIFHSSKLTMKRKDLNNIFRFQLMSYLLSIPLVYTKFFFIFPLLLSIPVYICFFSFLKQRNRRNDIKNWLYLLLFIIVINGLMTETMLYAMPLHFRKETAYSLSAMFISIIIFCFVVYNYRRVIVANKNKNMIQKENQKLECETLKAEIQPHYLFNTLSLIQSAYKEDIEKGDEFMVRFTDNFRSSLESMKKDLVPFEEEIETVTKYVDIENINAERPFELVIDLEFTDFLIPPLTLEPIVENTINYSRINKKDDGYVQISSRLENDLVIITIEDNGVGYDTSKIKHTSLGQRNLRERLRLLLNADVIVESEIGKGTKTTITFPYDKEKHV